MKDFLKTLKESGAITEFSEYAINEKIEQIISERDKEYQQVLEQYIPLFKQQGAWEQVNKQIMENLSKIGQKDWSKIHNTKGNVA